MLIMFVLAYGGRDIFRKRALIKYLEDIALSGRPNAVLVIYIYIYTHRDGFDRHAGENRTNIYISKCRL